MCDSSEQAVGAPALGGTSYRTVYAYNDDGSLAGWQDPAEGGLTAETVRQTYNPEDELLGVTGSQLYATVSVSGIGQPIGYARDSGSTYLRTGVAYDQATGQVLGIGDQTVTGSTLTQVTSRVYARDDAGQITSATDTTPSGVDTQCYGYDPLQELTAAWTPASNSCAAAPSSTALGGPAPYWESFTYDQATGNRLGETQHATSSTGSDAVSTYSYPAAGSAQPHAVTSIATTQDGATTTESFGYDASGDATQLGGVSAAYDAQGQTASLTSGGSTQSRVYDADGSLLLESDPTAGTTVFLGDTELHVAPGATAASASRTYTAGTVPIAERDTTAGVSGSKLYWLGSDIDGTADLEVDATTGAVTHRYTDPFGNPRGSSAPAWSSDRGYLNDSASSLTGLTQIGARLYDPATGSFTTADPLLTPDSFASRNAYAYAGNDPVTDTDPSGECMEPGGAISNIVNCAGGHGVTATGATIIDQQQTAAYDATPAGKKYIASLTAPKTQVCGFACEYASSQQAQVKTQGKQAVAFAKQLGAAALFGAGIAGDLGGLEEGDPDAGEGLIDDAQQAEEDALEAATEESAGWSTGDDIYAPTRAGNQPAWSTVRSRFWKNEAADPQYGPWSQSNIARMQRGLAPQRYNPDKGGLESMELSHEPIPYRDGGTEVIPRWPQDHAAIDPYRHPGY